MQCMAPSLASLEGVTVPLPLSAQMGLRMDGVSSLLTLNTSLTVHQNPLVNVFDSVMEFNLNDDIILAITVSIMLCVVY